VIGDFSHPQSTYFRAFMTSLPYVKTLLAIMFWKWFQYCYHIAPSVFMEFKIRFLVGNSFYFQRRGESHMAGTLCYIVCSSIGNPNNFWPKIAFLKNICRNMSVGIIQNELVWQRIQSFEMDIMC